MTISIEIPDEIGAALKEQAQAQGISPDRFVSRVLENTLGGTASPASQPFETGYGMWLKYGPGPSVEEIDANRREMFEGFAEDV